MRYRDTANIRRGCTHDWPSRHLELEELLSRGANLQPPAAWLSQGTETHGLSQTPNVCLQTTREIPSSTFE